MKIRVGFEMLYDFPQPTPMIMVLGMHFTRASDVIVPDFLTTSPSVPITPYRDLFGNWCSRIVAPAGRMRLAAEQAAMARARLAQAAFSSESGICLAICRFARTLMPRFPRNESQIDPLPQPSRLL